MIVAIVVGIGSLITWMASSGKDNPATIAATLERGGQAQFQAASDLATMLQTPGRAEKLKSSHELAEKVARLLAEKSAAGVEDDAAVDMRIFLCRALGEFEVTDGLGTLLEVAQKDPHRDVRRHAINAVSVLVAAASKLDPPQPLHEQELTAALLALAQDPDELVRSESAFALGVAAAAAPESRAPLADALATLADDPYTDARFNAALALARLGDERCVPGLVEMFDLASLEASLKGVKAISEDVTQQSLMSQQAFKRDLIVQNAARRIHALVDDKALSDESRAKLAAAVQKFLDEAPKVTTPKPFHADLLSAVQQMESELSGSKKASE